MKGRLSKRAPAPDHRYAALCAEGFRRFLLRFRADERIRAPFNRGKTVAGLERALARRGRQVLLRRLGARVGVLSAAAAVLFAIGWMWSGRPSEIVRSGGVVSRPTHALTVLGATTTGTAPAGAIIVGGGIARQPLTGGMTLEPGTGLLAPVGNEVRIGTAEGTVLTLERGGEMTVGEQSALRRFSLKQGAVRAQVTKLQAGERFIIATADADVEVHGTVFRVALVPRDPDCGSGIRTRVSVLEGVVRVRARDLEASVAAGETWPPGCAEIESGLAKVGVVGDQAEQTPPIAIAPRPMRPALAPPRSGRAVDARVEPTRSVVITRPSGVAVAPAGPANPATLRQTSASLLAAQNDLFVAALRASKQGQMTNAIRLFSRLIDTYPDGPLAEGAMAQRMRLLHSVDPEGAARAATQYLARFPGGFASAQARQLVGLTP